MLLSSQRTSVQKGVCCVTLLHSQMSLSGLYTDYDTELPGMQRLQVTKAMCCHFGLGQA